MFKHLTSSAFALVAAMAFAPDAAAQAPAQDRAAQPTVLEGVIVVAPRITYSTERRRDDPTDGSVLPYEVVNATETVPLQGLDLTRSRDVFALEERVEAAANRVCSQLEQKYPEGEPSKDVCVKRAVDDARARVRRMTRMTVGAR